MIRTLPAVAELRSLYPGAHIAWLVEAASADAIRSRDFVDEIVLFPRGDFARALRERRFAYLVREMGRFARLLRRRRFDLVMDFHGILKSGVLSALSGAPIRVGYAAPVARELAWLSANRRAALEPGPHSRFLRNAALVEFIGARPRRRQRPLLRPRPEALARVDALRAAFGEVSVAIHPGSSPKAAYKRYPVEGYAEMVRALALDPGVSSVVLSGPGREEARLADAIVEASAGAARRAPSTLEFEDLLAWLARARLFVGADSGPLHAASLVGTPVLQILGPTHPIENEPWSGTPWRRVRVPLACSPCRRGCESAHCMRLIPVQSVVAAARELLIARLAKPVASESIRSEESPLSAGATVCERDDRDAAALA